MKTKFKILFLLTAFLFATSISFADSLKDEFNKKKSKELKEEEAYENEQKRIYKEGSALANRIYQNNKLLICDKYESTLDFLKKPIADKAEDLYYRDHSYAKRYERGSLISEPVSSPFFYSDGLSNDERIFFAFIDDYPVLLRMSVPKYSYSQKYQQGSRLLLINDISYVRGQKTTEVTKNDERKPIAYEYYKWAKLDQNRIVKWNREEYIMDYKGLKLMKSDVRVDSYELRLDELSLYYKMDTKSYPQSDGNYQYIVKKDCVWADFYLNKIDVKAP
jgi:hypothetical protein